MINELITPYAATKRDKDKGGLIYAVALNPGDLVHFGDDVGDLLLQRLHVRVGRQAAENVGEVYTGIAVYNLRQHTLQGSRAEPARLLGQLRGNLLPKICKSRRDPPEEEAELGAVREVWVRRVDEMLQLQRQQLLVDVGCRGHQVLGPHLDGPAEVLGRSVGTLHQALLLAELFLQLGFPVSDGVERVLQRGNLQLQILN